MNVSINIIPAVQLLPLGFMLVAFLGAPFFKAAHSWKILLTSCLFSLGVSIFILLMPWLSISAPISHTHSEWNPWLRSNEFSVILSALVQFLGYVITFYSARYLQGESNQSKYAGALAGVLASVQLMLLANHWVVLIVAWFLVGIMLEQLLCFYRNRPFALLAAHKKRISDRLADVLLVLAASLAWYEVGSGSLSTLFTYIESNHISANLKVSAVLLVIAVIIRTALLPLHGWLMQVMEAPTPVSALLHAGVINLGGYVLILFSPLIEHVTAARWLLVIFGLITAILAGMVMLTRVSIKVRLAWSTAAQMGFMIMECGLGLYTLAALHMIGHSLYKAHVFLTSSEIVRQTRFKLMRGDFSPRLSSMLIAPLASTFIVVLVTVSMNSNPWPWWWCAILGTAWAPLLWLSNSSAKTISLPLFNTITGMLLILALSLIAALSHYLPIGKTNHPDDYLGIVTMCGMLIMHLCLIAVQLNPSALKIYHRWSYAGFYLDEYYTRITLSIWPSGWSIKSKALGQIKKANA